MNFQISEQKIPNNLKLANYVTMVKIRQFEEAIADAYHEQEMRSPTHLYTGHEAVATGVCAALTKGDKVVGYYRGHGYYLAMNGCPKAMMAELYCKSSGSNRGKGGSMLLSSPSVGYVASTALVSGGIPIATGIALANKLKNVPEVAVCFFGDAAVEEGAFHESINFAALKKLPIIFVCENNMYAVQSHIKARQSIPEQLFKYAEILNMPAVQIDGNDVESVYKHASQLIDRARRFEGPAFIEAMTYRWHEHVGPGDDTKFGWRPQEELNFWKKKDPIVTAETKLFNEGILTQKLKEQIYEEINSEVKTAFIFAKESALPLPEELLCSVY